MWIAKGGGGLILDQLFSPYVMEFFSVLSVKTKPRSPCSHTFVFFCVLQNICMFFIAFKSQFYCGSTV